jgi:hypothetical protein
VKFANYLRYSIPIAAIASIGSRFYISADGYLYLSSARSLFSPEFATNYHWVREPLYPFFLWLVHNFLGASDFFFSLFNLSVLALAISFTAWSFQMPKKLFLYLVIVIFLNSITVGLAGSILQQTLLSALVIALIPLIYRFTGTSIDPKFFSFKFRIITVAIGGLGCLLSFLFIPVILSVLFCNVFLVLLFRFLSSTKDPRKQKFFDDPLRKSILIVFIVLMPFLSWSFFKVNNAEDTFGRFKPWIGSSDFTSSFEDPKVSKLQILGALTSVTSDVGENTDYKSEIKIFGLGWPNTIQSERCGFYNDGWPEINAYAKDYVSPTCKPQLMWDLLLAIQPISLFLFRFFIVTSPFVFLYYILRRRFWRAIIYLPILTTFSVYFFFGMGISRYLYAIWPAVVFYFFTLFMKEEEQTEGIDKKLKRKSKNQNSNFNGNGRQKKDF